MSKHPDVMFTEPGEFVAELARDHADGLVERGDRPCHQGRPAGDERDDHARRASRRSAIVDHRCVSAAVACAATCGAWMATSRSSGAASELVRELESQLLDAGLELRAGLHDD